MFNDWIYNIIDDYSFRYEIYYGGSGSGKSYGAVSKVILKSCKSIRNVLIIRKVKSTILHSVYALVKNICNDAGFEFSENKSELEILLFNGSRFIFKGLDDSEKLKSITDITDIVIEEATELTLNDFTQLDIRLRPQKDWAQIYVLFNPVCKTNWCYSYWFEKKPENARVIHTTYVDNKFLSTEYKDTLSRLVKTNKNYYNIYCLGKFSTLDKLVFENFCVRKIQDDEVSDLQFFVGLDFGYVNDPSAIICGRYSSDTIYITREFVKKGMLNSEIYRNICNLNLSKEMIIADCAEMKSIDELRKLGVRIKPCKKGRGSVLSDIEFILNHRVVIDESCVETIYEFENYTWKKKNGDYINQPVDRDNHTIDALRYGLQAVFRKKGAIEIIKTY